MCNLSSINVVENKAAGAALKANAVNTIAFFMIDM